MSEFFEIAYAVASNRLCLFTGTGFSKAISGNSAPSWKSLLEDMSDKCANPNILKESLFPKDKDAPLTLEESAQVIALELSAKGLDLHQEVSELISKVSLQGDNSVIEEFVKKQSFRCITTNYDKLLESLCGADRCQSLTPGLPIPRASSEVKVYHVHGSIDSPDNMIITSENYFKFINNESYFSRKVSTIFYETTVVIIGYSLGDTNLKAILNDYKVFSKYNTIASSIFFVSRSKVDNNVKNYYIHCYGIRVIDNISVHDFFQNLNTHMEQAEACVKALSGDVKNKVLDENIYSHEALKVENTFIEFIEATRSAGLSINDPRVVKIIKKIITTKKELTSQSGAWEQYVHLAKWLIYISSILEIENTDLKESFLEATFASMTKMSKELLLGYSWHAYKAWDNKWDSIIPSNRIMIREYIINKTLDRDAIYIVNK